MSAPAPEWFHVSEKITADVMSRIAASVSATTMSPQVNSLPMLAHWFVLDTLLIANTANRDGMHANALALTRQCVEAMSIIELGVCQHHEAESALEKWENDALTPGKLRSWLSDNVWPHYGSGLWTEPWPTFMREFAGAVQPYAHYSRNLAQWQLRFHGMDRVNEEDGEYKGIIEMRPRAYDPQKATRITLFHSLICYTLGRIWVAANRDDLEFGARVTRLGIALGKSHYLDGHRTAWSQQFWAMVWGRDGETVLE